MGTHWDSLVALIPKVQSLTAVQIGNGHRTSFWLDSWDADYIPVKKFLVLFSHTLDKNATVAKVLSADLAEHSVLRLSTAANNQLLQFRTGLTHVILSDEPDIRSTRGEHRGVFSTQDRSMQTLNPPGQNAQTGYLSGETVLHQKFSFLPSC